MADHQDESSVYRRVYKEYQYAGFWIRLWALVIDNLLSLVITLPLLFAIYGKDEVLYSENENVFLGPAHRLIAVLFVVIVILFWVHYQATPGKMAISAKIVDAETGRKPSDGQCIGRFLAYIPSILGKV